MGWPTRAALRQGRDVTARAVIDSGADALAFLGYNDQAGDLARRLAAAGFDGVRVSSDIAMDDRYLTRAGGSAEGWYLVCPCFDATTSSEGRDFAARYGPVPPGAGPVRGPGV
jgi:branched-chain amino acid transport system substrate-binding protein